MGLKQDYKKSITMTCLKKNCLLIFILFFLIIWIGCQKAQNDLILSDNSAEQILEATGVSRGIFVLLDDMKCKTALDLVLKSELVLYCPFSKDEDVQAARWAAD